MGGGGGDRQQLLRFELPEGEGVGGIEEFTEQQGAEDGSGLLHRRALCSAREHVLLQRAAPFLRVRIFELDLQLLATHLGFSGDLGILETRAECDMIGDLSR